MYPRHWYHSEWKGYVAFTIKIGRLWSITDDIYGFASRVIKLLLSCYAVSGNGHRWVKYYCDYDSIVDWHTQSLQEGDEARFTLYLNGHEKKQYLKI